MLPQRASRQIESLRTSVTEPLISGRTVLFFPLCTCMQNEQNLPLRMMLSAFTKSHFHLSWEIVWFTRLLTIQPAGSHLKMMTVNLSCVNHSRPISCWSGLTRLKSVQGKKETIIGCLRWENWQNKLFLPQTRLQNSWLQFESKPMGIFEDIYVTCGHLYPILRLAKSAIIQRESNHLHPCEDKYSPNHDVLFNPSQVFLSLKTKQNKSQCWDNIEKRKLNLNKHQVATQRDLQIGLNFCRNIYSGNRVAHKATERFLDLETQTFWIWNEPISRRTMNPGRKKETSRSYTPCRKRASTLTLTQEKLDRKYVQTTN